MTVYVESMEKCSPGQSYKRLGDSLAAVGLGFAVFYWLFDALIRFAEYGQMDWQLLFVGTRLDVLEKVLCVTLFLFFSSHIKASLDQRHREEMELKKREEKYSSIMAAMKDGAYICSRDMTIEYLSPALEKRIGNGMVIGKSCYQTIYSRRTKCPWCVLDKVTRGECVDYELKDPKSSSYYSIANAPIENVDGSISQLTIFRDISNIKKMEKRLLHNQKMETIGTLAGGIAHDFNNILFPIIGNVELMLMDMEDNNPLREDLEQIHCGAMRAKDLVKQILSFSRKEHHELIPMRIQPVLRESLILMRATIPTTIEIKQEIDADCGMINADSTQIHQVVMNLAINSYHAMEKKGGLLKIALHQVVVEENDTSHPGMKPGRYSCLNVSDTGEGIGEDIINHIFDPFFTTKKKGKGTGIGLSVVDYIVKSLDGVIDLKSIPGQGTEFQIYFPTVEHSCEEMLIKSTENIQVGGDERILLVDDEDYVLSMESNLLKRMGYQVVSFNDSVEALKAFRADPMSFDLVISDMAMPRIPGDILTAELRSIRTDMPILLCSGYSENLNPKIAAQVGANAMLMKPIGTDEFTQKVRELLNDSKVMLAN